METSGGISNMGDHRDGDTELNMDSLRASLPRDSGGLRGRGRGRNGDQARGANNNSRGRGRGRGGRSGHTGPSDSDDLSRPAHFRRQPSYDEDDEEDDGYREVVFAAPSYGHGESSVSHVADAGHSARGRGARRGRGRGGGQRDRGDQAGRQAPQGDQHNIQGQERRGGRGRGGRRGGHFNVSDYFEPTGQRSRDSSYERERAQTARRGGRDDSGGQSDFRGGHTQGRGRGGRGAHSRPSSAQPQQHSGGDDYQRRPDSAQRRGGRGGAGERRPSRDGSHPRQQDSRRSRSDQDPQAQRPQRQGRYQNQDSNRNQQQQQRQHGFGGQDNQNPNAAISTPQRRDRGAGSKREAGAGPSDKGRRVHKHYPEYMRWEDVRLGLQRGELIEASLRISAANINHAFASAPQYRRDLFIDGRKARNRAFDGDVVVLRVLGQKEKEQNGAGRKRSKSNAQIEGKGTSLQLKPLSSPQVKPLASPSLKPVNTGASPALPPLSSSSSLPPFPSTTVSASPALATQPPSVSEASPALGPSQAGSAAPPLTALPSTSASSDLLSPTKGTYPLSDHESDMDSEVETKDVVQEMEAVLKSVPEEDEEDFVVGADSDPQYTAEVVYIVEANHPTTFAGYLKRAKTTDKVAIFVPLDKKAPFGLLPKSQWPAAYAQNPAAEHNTVYKVDYAPWLSSHHQPWCNFRQALGQSGALPTETEALLTLAQVDYDHEGRFDPLIEQEMAPFEKGWKVPEDEIKRRVDLRSERIFSIDPPTARDLDDALSITPLSSGHYRIGVHIADVSHFVRPGTETDREAEHRATTIYLIQKAIPMLPPVLCEQLCSLNPGVDRLAFSVFWDMTADGKVVQESPPWFGKTVIRSCSKLDYPTAQLMIECEPATEGKGPKGSAFNLGPELQEVMYDPQNVRYPVNGQTCDDMIRDVKLLHTIAVARRKARYDNGSLSLTNPRLSFRLDEQGLPTEFYIYEQKDSNRLVEEYMLLANQMVAERLVLFCKQNALLRCHPPPSKSIEKVQKVANSLGIPLDITSSNGLHRSLSNIPNLSPEVCPLVNKLVDLRSVMEHLCTKPMQPAKYICTGDPKQEDFQSWHHYALNFDMYTHFTSPIRRYADVIVHRLLEYTIALEQRRNAAAANNVPAPALPLPAGLERKNVSMIAEHCNKRKMNSKKAQEQSGKVYLCHYIDHFFIRQKKPFIQRAVITDLGEKAFDILITALGIEKRVYIEDIKATSARIVTMKAGERNATIGNQGANAEVKERKVLRIQWAGQLADTFYEVFDPIDVQLTVRHEPPVDLLVTTVTPLLPAAEMKPAVATARLELDPSIQSTPLSPVDD